jgi:hypothetical protein
VQLLGLEQNGEIVTARVLVSEPGLTSESVLEPSYNLADEEMVARPEFPGLRYQLGLEAVDLENNSALLNIEAPGTGLLGEPAHALYLPGGDRGLHGLVYLVA